MGEPWVDQLLENLRMSGATLTTLAMTGVRELDAAQMYHCPHCKCRCYDRRNRTMQCMDWKCSLWVIHHIAGSQTPRSLVPLSIHGPQPQGRIIIPILIARSLSLPQVKPLYDRAPKQQQNFIPFLQGWACFQNKTKQER